MHIRKSAETDFKRIMEIYGYARNYMAEHGNPNQWGPTNWPPEELIHNDIRDGNSYVCVNDEKRVIGVLFFIHGKDIEPTYMKITDGAWLEDSPYGVVHRIAGDGSEKGIGEFCINWAFQQCGHLRIDTHGDNTVMQNLVKKLGFIHCGTIYVEEDNYPRLAYEKVSDEKQYRDFSRKPKSKFFNELTTIELYEILKARAEIFVVEQNCVYQDLDNKDYNSLHIFFEENEKVTAYLRAFRTDENTVQMGRVLTVEHGTGLGGRLLKEGIRQIVEKMHVGRIYIEAQCYAAGYYEKEGFQICSDEFMEDGIPHVGMELILNEH